MSYEVEGLIEEKDEKGMLLTSYIVKNGKRDGEYRTFYPSGSVKSSTRYRNGVLSGRSVFYNEEGKPVSEATFAEGKAEGNVKRYYSGGRLYADLFYEGGKESGEQRYYYEDGSVRSVISYRNGILHGETILFWPSGEVKRRCRFIEGKKEGREEIRSAKGIILDEGEFTGGIPIGFHIRRYLNGTPKEEILYRTDGGVDIRKFDPEGRLEYERIHEGETAVTETRYYPSEGTKITRKGTRDGKQYRWQTSGT